MNIAEAEIRMRCIEQAVTLSGRQQNHTTERVIAIATELCKYVSIGSSPTVSASGDADARKGSPPPNRDAEKKTAAKSG